MTKEEMEKKLEELERRIKVLENRPTPQSPLHVRVVGTDLNGKPLSPIVSH